MENLIIAVGLNEDIRKDENPNVPYSPEEIAADIAACAKAGATIIHLHARNPVTGATDYSDPNLYRAVWKAVQQQADVPIYMTYNGMFGGGEAGYRHVEAIRKDPALTLEIAPVISGSFEFSPGVHEPVDAWSRDHVMKRPGKELIWELDYARKNDLWVSHDVMEPGGVRNAAALWAHKMYARPMLLKFFMSDQWSFGLPPEVRYLDTYRSLIPVGVDAEWLVLPYGTAFDRAMALWKHAIANGGHVRVGVGDNGAPVGGFLPTNAERVAEIASIARGMGREIATVEEVRTRFAPLAAA